MITLPMAAKILHGSWACEAGSKIQLQKAALWIEKRGVRMTSPQKASTILCGNLKSSLEQAKSQFTASHGPDVKGGEAKSLMLG